MRIFFVFFLLAATSVSAQTHLSGYILTKDGKTVWADELVTQEKHKGQWRVRLKHEGTDVASEIPQEQVAKIIVSHHYSGSKVDAVVVLEDGRKFEIVRSYLTDIFMDGGERERIRYMKYDPISQQLKRNYLAFKKIAEVHIDSAKGNLKVDAQGNTFPPEYLFSPYSGEKLQFGNFSPE